jgi:hypothetical protein
VHRPATAKGKTPARKKTTTVAHKAAPKPQTHSGSSS